MAPRQVGPATVSELRLLLRGIDDVGEQQRRQDAVRLLRLLQRRREFSHQLHRQLVRGVVDPREVAPHARQLMDPHIRDATREELRRSPLRGREQDEGGDPHRRQDVRDVGVHRRPEVRGRRARTQASPHVRDEPVLERRVVGGIRSALLEEAEEVLALAPVRADVVQALHPFALGDRPWIVVATEWPWRTDRATPGRACVPGTSPRRTRSRGFPLGRSRARPAAILPHP